MLAFKEGKLVKNRLSYASKTGTGTTQLNVQLVLLSPQCNRSQVFFASSGIATKTRCDSATFLTIWSLIKSDVKKIIRSCNSTYTFLHLRQTIYNDVTVVIE